jgi:hypothetical protein
MSVAVRAVTGYAFTTLRLHRIEASCLPQSSQGGGYDPSVMGAKDGFGAAGPPPGNPSGSVLNFGRFAGWSLGEIAGRDVEYIEWLDRSSIGRQYRDEIDAILRQVGRRKSGSPEEQRRRGLFRRR